MPSSSLRPKVLKAISRTAALGILLAIAAPRAHAVDGTFNSFFGYWDNIFDWVWDIAEGEDSTAYFPLGSTVTLETPRSIGHINITTLNTVTITGSTLTLSRSNNDGATFTVPSSPVFSGSAHVSTRLAGNDGFVKLGGGTLYLNNATNSFSGTMWFQGGFVVGSVIANEGVNSSFGRAPFAFDGGFMQYTGASVTTNRSIHLQGFGGIFVDNAAATLTVTGSVNGAGALSKYGDGGFVIPSNSTFAGDAIIGGGTWTGSSLRNSGQTSSFGAGDGISLLNDGVLVYTGAGQSTNRTLSLSTGTSHGITVVDAGATLNWTGVIEGTGGFTKSGPGTMTLSGSVSNTQSDAVVVKQGALLLSKTGGAVAISGSLTVGDGDGDDRATLLAADQIANTGLLTVNSSGTFKLNGFDEAIGGLAGSGIVENDSVTTSATLTVAGSQSTTFSGTLRNGSGGAPLGLTKSGTGTLTLTEPAAITGGVTVANGRLKLGGANLLPANSSIAIFGGTLEVGPAETTNSIVMLGGAIEGGSLVANDRFELQAGSITANLAGNGYLEKGGGGELTLSGVGTYSGYTAVTAGKLTLVGAERLPNTTALTVDGELVLGGAETIGSLAGAGDVELHGQLTVDGDANTSFTGDITGDGTLRKRGTGTLQLLGTSTHAVTLLEGGVLQGNAATIHGQVVNDSNLYMFQPADAAFEGTITGSGAFNKSGEGKLTFQNAQLQSTGPMHVFDGTLALPTGLNIGGGNTLGSQPQGAIEAAGFVARRVTSEGRITATGDLFIGDLTSNDGFAITGTLEVGAHDVVLLDQNVAHLGAVTTIADGGQLTALHGLQLDENDALTATGEASVRGDINNQGLITGPAEGWLTLEDDVTGAGDYAGNIRFGDGFTPGNSPAVVTFENVIFDPSSTLTLEIGGTGAGEFDQLIFNGTAQLDGTLLVDFIDLGGGEYEPSAGDVFELFTGDVAGSFANVVLPDLPDHLLWDATSFADGVVEIAVVPPNADFDDDGYVNGTDFLTWQRRLGATNGGVERAGDADFDGVVDAADLEIIRGQFGPAPEATAAAAPVPEPAAAALLLIAIAQLAVQCRRA